MSVESVSPTIVEDAIREVVAAAVKLPQVAAQDNMLDLGVESLVGTRIVVDLRSRFDVDVPLVEIFENPVISDFANVVWQLIEDERD